MKEEVTYYDVPQGSPEWHEVKLGIPSASGFGQALADGGGKVRDEYMRKLAGEIITGVPRENYRSAAMDRGSEMEPDLRAMYAMMMDVEPEQVGFVTRKTSFGVIGSSPDSLVGLDGCVEFKSAAPHVLIEIMRAGKAPPEHLPQCQGTMRVLGRAWCDLVIGYRGMPLFRRRIRRDESAIRRLDVGLEVFCQELAELVDWIRKYGREG